MNSNGEELIPIILSQDNNIHNGIIILLSQNNGGLFLHRISREKQLCYPHKIIIILG